MDERATRCYGFPFLTCMAGRSTWYTKDICVLFQINSVGSVILGVFPITDNKTSWSEQGLGAGAPD